MRERFAFWYRQLKTARPAVRMGVGVLLVIGGMLGFLPVLGFWMIPLGVGLLAVDFPWVRRLMRRSIIAMGRLVRRYKRRGPWTR
jgi:UPF0716 family protein affecting phage T7 exclusion